MRFLTCFLVLLAAPLVQAGPPKLVVSPNGDVSITSGGTVIVVKSDGSVSVKSPAVDLTIPPSAPSPVVPEPIKPDPVKPDVSDPVADQIGTLYGSLQEDGKEAKTRTLSGVWFRAVSLVDSVNTVGELETALSKIQTLKDTDLVPIRTYISRIVTTELGKIKTDLIDKPKARALFKRIAEGLEKAVTS